MNSKVLVAPNNLKDKLKTFLEEQGNGKGSELSNSTSEVVTASRPEAFDALNEYLSVPQLQELTLDFLPPEDFSPWAPFFAYQPTMFKMTLNSRFWKCVVLEEYDAVQSMLKHDPYLMVQRGRITDCSQRTFENTSGFEYVMWAWSKHMWEAMLDCVPDNQNDTALWSILLSQYKKVSTVGVTYTKNGVPITEHHFDFENTLFKELQLQIIPPNPPDSSNLFAMDRQWRYGVGGAQNLLPMCVVDEYLSDEPFDPPPKFVLRPKSARKFYNWETGLNEDWFCANSKRGIYFAIYKGPAGRGGMAVARWGGAFVRIAAGVDLHALRALFRVRQIDFINLGEYLENMVMALKHQPQIAPNKPLELSGIVQGPSS